MFASSASSSSSVLKLTSAVFYAATSLLMTVTNKTVLTSFRFPSYTCLGIGQMLTTVIVLFVGKLSRKVHFQDCSRDVVLRIFPLPLLYVGNHITGLASTKKLSLPMFTVLRKFTILMTMILEFYVLRKTFPRRLLYCVIAIVLGAALAASSDLTFHLESYLFVLLNDAFTAANTVFTKKKLTSEGLGKFSVLFYNALIIVVPTTLLSAFSGDLRQAVMFDDWSRVSFVVCFFLSCINGFLLMLSLVLCSHYNSALTTTVVGSIKNVLVCFVGVLLGEDYLFTWINFLGLSVCMSAGLVYSYLTFSDGGAEEPLVVKVEISSR